MRKHNARGESLVEVLAAIVIFTFGSVTLLTMLSAGARVTQSARERNRAQAQALWDMELGQTQRPGTVCIRLDGREELVDVVFTGEWVWFSGGGE